MIYCFHGITQDRLSLTIRLKFLAVHVRVERNLSLVAVDLN